MKEALDENSTPDPPKPTMKSRELGGLEMSLVEAWKPWAEGSCRNHTGKLAKLAELSLEDEEFGAVIPIYAAAAISDDHEVGIVAKSYKAAAESPLTDKWVTAMNAT
jgi:hypothetical protein